MLAAGFKKQSSGLALHSSDTVGFIMDKTNDLILDDYPQCNLATKWHHLIDTN